MAIKPVRRNKNPPILSHEFIIQNHGDIISCVAMVIVMGLMFQASSPLASLFIIMQNPIERENTDTDEPILYTSSLVDLAAVFFYGLIAIVVHAIVQDYVLDRANRKLHLSKTKHSKFNESGQLLLFNLFSAAWGLHIIFRDESLTSLFSLWHNYPEDHVKMSFRLKFYFIIQLAYWLHSYPELYFQKVKREEIYDRVLYASLHLLFIAAAYVFNFTRLTLVLLVLHYSVESALHASRLLYYADMATPANKGFKAYNITFVVFRLISLMLTILAIHFGLGGQAGASVIDFSTGNFNTPLVRYATVLSVVGLQVWLGYRFITFHLAKKREKKAEQLAAQKKRQQLARAARKSKKGSDDDVALLPEVDQNTRRRR